jgi:hypothetical protein
MRRLAVAPKHYSRLQLVCTKLHQNNDSSRFNGTSIYACGPLHTDVNETMAFMLTASCRRPTMHCPRAQLAEPPNQPSLASSSILASWNRISGFCANEMAIYGSSNGKRFGNSFWAWHVGCQRRKCPGEVCLPPAELVHHNMITSTMSVATMCEHPQYDVYMLIPGFAEPWKNSRVILFVPSPSSRRNRSSHRTRTAFSCRRYVQLEAHRHKL